MEEVILTMGHMMCDVHNDHNHNNHLPPHCCHPHHHRSSASATRSPHYNGAALLQEKLVPQHKLSVCVFYGVLAHPVVVVLTNTQNSTPPQLTMNITITQKLDGVPKFFNYALSATM